MKPYPVQFRPVHVILNKLNRAQSIAMVFGILMMTSPVIGQQYAFKMKSIGVEDGLSSRTINGYFQDSKGLLWIGTDFGLNRYDGNQVRSYNQENGELVSNYVKYFAEDFEGNIWTSWEDPNLGNKYATQVFNPAVGKAISLKEHFKDYPEIADLEVLKMSSFESTKELWFGTKNGIYLYSPEHYEIPTLISSGSFQLISMEACARGVWVSTRGKLMLIDREGKKLQEILNDPARPVYLYGLDPSDDVYHHVRIPDQTSKTGEVAMVHAGSRPFGGSDKAFWYGKEIIGIDHYRGRVWCRDANDDVVVYDQSLNEIFRDYFEESFYTHTKPFHFDRFGNAWTNQGGRINIISLRIQKFRNYLNDVKVYTSLGYGARGLYVDDNDQLYTSGLGRSYKVDLQTGTKVEFAPSPDFYTSPTDDLRWGKRLGLFADNKNNLWYSDEGNRLARINIKSENERSFTYSPEQRAINDASPERRSMRMHWSIYIDRRERLWLGRKNGLVFLNRADSSLHLFQNYGAFPELSYSEVLDFHENDEGIWIASQTGLYLMNNDYQIVNRFHKQADEGAFIPHNSIAHIHEDKAGIFWLATKGGGIIRLNTETGEYRQFTETDGLSNNTVYAVYDDDGGNLWVPSNKGIMRIDTAGFRVITYLKGDGLVQEEFNTLSHFKAKDGRLFFGHLNGVTAFDPKDFEKPGDASAKLVVTTFEKQSKQTGLYETELANFLEKEAIQIRPSEVGFNIGFSLLNYLDAESNLYSYKIQGIDQNWNFVNTPVVRINALPYGDYELQLRGQASQGLWSDVMSIPIQVIRPFYLTTWFILSIIILALLTAYLVIKMRERSLLIRQQFLETEIDKRTLTIQEQANELKELDELKSKFFANVSHELRTPLSLVVAPIRNLIKNPNIDEQGKRDLIRVKKNSEQIEKLVEEILDLTKLENKKIAPHYKAIRPTQFFSRIHNNFESKAQSEGIRFFFSFKGDDSGFALDVNMTERILNNLLSNAFKFTPSGSSIEMSVNIDSEKLWASVKDKGIGISAKDLPHVFDRFFQTKDSERAASGGTGIGLALSKELAQAMDGDLTVKSEQGQGSEFVLTLPNINASMLPKHGLRTENTTSDKILVPLSNKKRPKILVVEDHRDMRSFIVENLLQQFEPAEAANGAEALMTLTSNGFRPDIIISDMMMPEMDGMELLASIRDNDDLRDIPVIMLTARTADKDKLEAFRLGVDDYLVKPFSVDELKARIKNQLKVSESKRVANLVSDVDYAHENQIDEPLEEWLLKVKQLTQENVHKVDFNIASIAEKMNLSQRQFQRRLKSTTGYTPGVYLKEIRLQMARVYLEKKEYDQVQAVSMAVGFTSVNYFSRLYKNRFGKGPGEYFQASVVD